MTNVRPAIWDLLVSRTAAHPSAPFLTWYDDSDGARVELSWVTFANAVAKAANLLVDGLALEPGCLARITVPLHWQLPVWAAACWSAGLIVTTDPDARVDVTITSVAEVDPLAADTLAVSLHPFGFPLPEPLPPGVLNASAEVRIHGDRYAPAFTDAGHMPAHLSVGGSQTRQHEMLDSVAHHGHGKRRLVTNDHDWWMATLITPLATDGSVVIVSNADPAKDHASMEHVDD